MDLPFTTYFQPVTPKKSAGVRDV